MHFSDTPSAFGGAMARPHVLLCGIDNGRRFERFWAAGFSVDQCETEFDSALALVWKVHRPHLCPGGGASSCRRNNNGAREKLHRSAIGAVPSFTPLQPKRLVEPGGFANDTRRRLAARDSRLDRTEAIRRVPEPCNVTKSDQVELPFSFVWPRQYPCRTVPVMRA